MRVSDSRGSRHPLVTGNVEAASRSAKAVASGVTRAMAPPMGSTSTLHPGSGWRAIASWQTGSAPSEIVARKLDFQKVRMPNGKASPRSAAMSVATG